MPDQQMQLPGCRPAGNQSAMIKNYLKIALRHITRHKAYSFLNISGLAIGMASSILILLWVQNEWSYDRFHAHADQIYRITCNAGDFQAAVNCAGMPAGLQAQIPFVKHCVRISQLQTSLYQAGDRKFEDKQVIYADSNFLDFFSFPLLRGNPKTALSRPDGILITEDMARKYFGSADPMGKTLLQDNYRPVVVTGVLAQIPSNSHLQFDFVQPLIADVDDGNAVKNNVWDNFDFYSYLELDQNFVPTPAALKAFERQINEIYKQRVTKLKIDFHLQPLTSIHLHSHFQVDLPGHGNVLYVQIFFVVALFILAVACINFMNLATARSARRAKEVGLRKVVGAARSQLIGQYLGESILISVFAMLLALFLVELALPAFRILAGKNLALNLLQAKVWFSLIGMVLVTGICAGIYPALLLSGFQTVNVLKGVLRLGGGHRIFRNSQVVCQFIVSIVLLAGTMVIYQQLRFIQRRNPGFEKENLLYVAMQAGLYDHRQALRAKLQENPLTYNYCIVSALPIFLVSGTIGVSWEGYDPRRQIVFPSMYVSEDFLNVFRIKLLSGRSFSAAFPADSSNYLINETAMHIMGFTTANAVGKNISFAGRKGKIIGVTQDFNFKPIQQPIEPLVLGLNAYGGYVVIRTKPGATEATIQDLGRLNRELNPDYPLVYNFLDQDLANLYTGERQMGKIFNLFAILGVMISCLGLYGLSAFMSEQRTKEIGVRKVLGATEVNLVYLLSKKFTRLVLIAAAIAIPLSWYAAKRWLNGFSFHIQPSIWVFLLAGLAALGVTWLTVSYESLKAAITNPTQSLRME